MNPFTALPKLIKTKSAVDCLQSLAKGITMQNWKTSLCGIATCLITLGLIWAPAQYQSKIHATAAALAGVGLIAAKDAGNKQ